MSTQPLTYFASAHVLVIVDDGGEDYMKMEEGDSDDHTSDERKHHTPTWI